MGAPGTACPERGCAKRGYHHIHEQYVARRVEDPMVGTVISDFLVVGVLGVGGFGNVYHVLQLPLRDTPLQGALKLLRIGAADDARRELLISKFETEADALSALTHPNIVRLLRAGLEAETPFLIIELVEDARTLKKELMSRAKRGEPLSNAELRDIIHQMLNALEAAHGKGIVHRDIKPSNVMLQRAAGYRCLVKVVDFGLAKFVSDQTNTNAVVGTPLYMAPEQLHGRHIGPWTDLYALGVLLLEIVTGRTAFSDEREALMREKLDPAFDAVGRATRGLGMPEEVLSFFRRAVAYDHRDRFASVKEFRRALKGVLRDDASADRGVSPLGQAAEPQSFTESYGGKGRHSEVHDSRADGRGRRLGSDERPTRDGRRGRDSRPTRDDRAPSRRRSRPDRNEIQPRIRGRGRWGEGEHPAGQSAVETRQNSEVWAERSTVGDETWARRSHRSELKPRQPNKNWSLVSAVQSWHRKSQPLGKPRTSPRHRRPKRDAAPPPADWAVETASPIDRDAPRFGLDETESVELPKSTRNNRPPRTAQRTRDMAEPRVRQQTRPHGWSDDGEGPPDDRHSGTNLEYGRPDPVVASTRDFAGRDDTEDGEEKKPRRTFLRVLPSPSNPDD